MSYSTIVADPPWRYNATTTELRSNGRGAGAEHHYPTMDNAEIAALQVASVAADQAHLYLWVTNTVGPDGSPRRCRGKGAGIRHG